MWLEVRSLVCVPCWVARSCMRNYHMPLATFCFMSPNCAKHWWHCNHSNDFAHDEIDMPKIYATKKSIKNIVNRIHLWDNQWTTWDGGNPSCEDIFVWSDDRVLGNVSHNQHIYLSKTHRCNYKKLLCACIQRTFFWGIVVEQQVTSCYYCHLLDYQIEKWHTFYVPLV